MPSSSISRRQLLLGTAAVPLLAAGSRSSEDLKHQLVAYLEKHRKSEGGYGWTSDVVAHVTPTFAVVGCYHLLNTPIPDRETVARFIREHYPVPEIRRKERPLWRLDYEQIQTLLWLDEPIDSFRALAETWTAPAEFTNRYELDGNPVFQHQAMAVRVRHLLKLSPGSQDDQWRNYFHARRRQNGTFNNTPAKDASDGHLMNTLWGLWALESLGEDVAASRDLIAWTQSCQLPSGGFTYAPGATLGELGHGPLTHTRGSVRSAARAEPRPSGSGRDEVRLGAVDDLAYTWAALQILAKAKAKPKNSAACAEWIHSLQTKEAGYQDRPGSEPNPLATFYALDCLRFLQQQPQVSRQRASTAAHHPIPSGSKVFSIQIEAPGTGSPREAVLLADKLGIHLWAAKNAAPGWVEEAQRIANEQKVPVQFTVGNEEYGTFVSVPGLGTYSHLSDLIAPVEGDFGAQLPKKNYAYPWPGFRDTRIAALKKAGGRMIWQFNENEEITRILLDEAVQKGTYGAISSFHFGNENFLHSQPFLMRWCGRLPFVALQDAHASESWWWGDQLAGFTTLFIAQEPTWDAWLKALEHNHVLSVRHDRISNWKTHLAGGPLHVREFILARQHQWRWWDDDGNPARRLPIALTVLKPGMKFEAGVPQQGSALRLRLWADNTTQGAPKEPRVELVSFKIDGETVQPKLVSEKKDSYYIYGVTAPGKHRASARIRVRSTQKEHEISESWEN